MMHGVKMMAAALGLAACAALLSLGIYAILETLRGAFGTKNFLLGLLGVVLIAVLIFWNPAFQGWFAQ